MNRIRPRGGASGIEPQQSPESADVVGVSRGSVRARRRPAPHDRRGRTGRRGRGAAVLAVLLLAVVAAAVLRGFVVDVYTVDQISMRPTLEDSERILVDKRLGAVGEHGDLQRLHRGDVVVFDGTGSFAPYESQSELDALAARLGHWAGVGSPPATYVKRVIGMSGDTVACCDAAGRLLVDGEPLEEPYLPEPVSAARPASEQEFEVEVPPGRVWVMGDNRRESVDSRDLLGAPGGGMISQARLIGRADEVVWPWSARRPLDETPEPAEADGPTASSSVPSREGPATGEASGGRR